MWIVLQHLDFQPSDKTLDVGGTDNQVSAWLEAAGCESWVVDLRPYGYPLQHFIQGDFKTAQIPENYFDIAFDISAIHHFGVEHYLPVEDEGDDIVAVKKVYDSLKLNGVLYACMDRFKTTYAATEFFHQYHDLSFKIRYVQGFRVEEMFYYDVNCNQVPYGAEFMEIVYAKLRKTGVT